MVDYLDGQVLIAMPGMEDSRFAGSVVYICAHSDEGAMGIVINQLSSEITFVDLLEQLNITPEGGEAIRLPDLDREIPVLQGGPVETGRGFVLHSADYHIENSTLAIDSEVSLTATQEILRAMATGGGPSSALLALGYAGWAPGQLENELRANGWLNCKAGSDIIFDRDLASKYRRSLEALGINPAMLSSEGGQA